MAEVTGQTMASALPMFTSRVTAVTSWCAAKSIGASVVIIQRQPIRHQLQFVVPQRGFPLIDVRRIVPRQRDASQLASPP
ncbi:MAG: hypothetical protein U0528_09285 [Anaerolineae bacterium]